MDPNGEVVGGSKLDTRLEFGRRLSNSVLAALPSAGQSNVCVCMCVWAVAGCADPRRVTDLGFFG